MIENKKKNSQDMENTDAYQKIAYYDNYLMDLSKVYYQKIIKDVIDLCKGGTILDIGCYDGSLSNVFLKRGYKVYGIEAHHEAYQRALQKGIGVVKGNIENGLPWESNSFNCVIAAEIIEHIYDTDKFLNDIKRVLKKDGILILSLPNVGCLTNRVRLLLGSYPRYCEYQAGKSGGHVRVYTFKAIKTQLNEHNFDIVRARGANFPFPMQKKFIPTVFKKLAKIIGDYTPGLSGQIILSARVNK